MILKSEKRRRKRRFRKMMMKGKDLGVETSYGSLPEEEINFGECLETAGDAQYG